MNPFLYPFLLAAFSLLVASPLNAAPEARATQPMRNPATHDQLSQSLRMAQQGDPIRNLGPAMGKTEVDPSTVNSKRDLIRDSTILCYRGFLTLIPKRSVLHLPEKLRDRFEAQPNIKVQTWANFYQANRGWIRTVEVTREQAMGQVAMPEAVVEAFKTSSSAVIATFKGSPISVIPLKEPVDETATAAALKPSNETIQP